MADYTTRRQIAGMRSILRNARTRVEPLPNVGGAVAPENAMQLTGRGQLTAIWDVLDADGNELFVLGVNGMADTDNVE